MRIEVGVDGFRALVGEIRGDLAEDVTAAMRETMPIAKQELREQVTGSGLGPKLANTWRGEVYPRSRASIEPAGYIYSRAPDIVDAFERGATIYPTGGRKFLAIPSDNVPVRGGRRGSTRPMTPLEVEATFNQDLFFLRGKQGRLLAFVNVVRSRSQRGGGIRRATRRRVASGRQAERVLMFTMVPVTRLPKLLDIAGVAERWAGRFERAFMARLGGR